MLILLLSSRQLDNISLNDKKIYLNVNFFFLAFLANSNLYLHFIFNYFMNLKKYFLLRLNPVRILGSAFLKGVRIYRRAVVTHNSKSDLPLSMYIQTISHKFPPQ